MPADEDERASAMRLQKLADPRAGDRFVFHDRIVLSWRSKLIDNVVKKA